MVQEQFEKYIRLVALRHNITPAEVLQDIEHCIKESAEAVRNSNNPAAIESWQQIPKAGADPTPYEFLSHISHIVLQILVQQDHPNA